MDTLASDSAWATVWKVKRKCLASSLLGGSTCHLRSREKNIYWESFLWSLGLGLGHSSCVCDGVLWVLWVLINTIWPLGLNEPWEWMRAWCFIINWCPCESTEWRKGMKVLPLDFHRKWELNLCVSLCMVITQKVQVQWIEIRLKEKKKNLWVFLGATSQKGKIDEHPWGRNWTRGLVKLLVLRKVIIIIIIVNSLCIPLHTGQSCGNREIHPGFVCTTTPHPPHPTQLLTVTNCL